MALVGCKECKKEVSSKAKTCPHCGVKKPYKPNLFKLRLSVVILMAFMFILVSAAKDKEGVTQSKESSLAPFTKQQICMATISTVMGKSPSIMSVDRISGEVTYVSYVRPDDGKKWAYRCKTNGSYSIWASETGRWREHPLDSEITFSVAGSTLKILEEYSDGSSINKSFSLQELGG